MNTSSHIVAVDEQTAWNQAHDRLRDFLNAFALGDHAQISRLTLKLLDQARERHCQDPSLDPVSLAMAQAQKLAREWFASNLEMRDQPPAELLASGCVALLLSGAFRTAPKTFLTAPLPENLKESMRQTLLVTGPDLKISSMTPRHLDYGPMLDLARRTWHRWNSREIIIALLFWTVVYFVFYWWLSEAL
ncbi:MAG TPA: hypothetical protein VGZ93_12080 [Candidatus Methylacidiphilales bacterium]|jgi:hypothetical protein|nr:hypothetical protein [Candidatus Methylacidiphilales bacterium]